MRLKEAVNKSIGCTDGIAAARLELQLLLADYDTKIQQYEQLMSMVQTLCEQIPEVAELVQITISKRGHSRLRAILFRADIALAGKNTEFQSLHHYYTTRPSNPLKKKQSIIALSCKLIRVFYTIATKGCAHDPVKMLADIHRNQPSKAQERYKTEAKNSELKCRHGYDVASSSGLVGMQLQGAATIFLVNIKRILKLMAK